MTAIAVEQILTDLETSLPKATWRLGVPLRADGVWDIEIAHDSKNILVYCYESGGFGVSKLDRDDPLYTHQPDELIGTIDQVQQRVHELLT